LPLREQFRRFDGVFRPLCLSFMYHDAEDSDTEHSVKLSRADIRAAKRLLGLLIGSEHAPAVELELEPAAEPSETLSRQAMVDRARDEFGNRRRRLAIFNSAIFGETAWDMLLALYILDLSGQRQTVGGLVKASGASMTTAIRWLNFLVAQDLVRRDPHPTDLRTAFVSLTPTARNRLDLYYSGTVARGV